MMKEHIPVLFDEVLRYLKPRSGGRYLDGTLGSGGHSAGILKLSAPDGRVLAFDRDPDALANARTKLARFGSRISFICANYADMGRLAPDYGFGRLDGVLLDLGLSSRQLADSSRGFSFSQDGPLDMRFNPDQPETAADFVNNLGEMELADLFWRYGEERQSRRFARAIVANRPLSSTLQLADLIASQVPRRGRVHPATRVFQALRIATNRELESMQKGLLSAIELLETGARVAVISFHSLEDRFVKQTFRKFSKACICPPEQPVCNCGAEATLRLVTRKALKATAAELDVNPRSRSARLRVAEKLG